MATEVKQTSATSQEIIELDNRYVMRTYGRLQVALVRGEGVYVWDADGRRYLDLVGGIAVNGLGHCHPKVVDAICRQASTLIHTSNLYYTEPQARLAKLLVEWSDFDKAFFCNSGTEANEAAMKLARKHAKLHGSPDKIEIITAEHSFHGRTMGSITATGQPKYQNAFLPLVPGFKHVPYNDLKALKSAVTDKTCAVMLEPVQGESGVHPASRAYLEGARKLCDEAGALLIFDEVQTGLGRTGRMFGYEHYGVVPDIMTLAKTLGGGFPIGACLARGEAAGTFEPGDHAATFGGNPLAAAAAIATVTAIQEEGLVENARDVGGYFEKKLRALKKKRKDVADVRGLGLMLALEFTEPIARTVQTRCIEQGLIVNAIGDRIIRFVPPLILTREQVDTAVSIIEAALVEP